MSDTCFQVLQTNLNLSICIVFVYLFSGIAEKSLMVFFETDPPMVRITTGAFLNLSSIQEGQDIYFLCQVGICRNE